MVKIKIHYHLTIITILSIAIVLVLSKLYVSANDINIVSGKIYDEASESKLITTKSTSNQTTKSQTNNPKVKTIVEKDETIDGKSRNTYSTITTTTTTNTDGTIKSTTKTIEDKVVSSNTNTTPTNTQVVDRTIVFKPGVPNSDINLLTQNPDNIEKTIITVSSKNSDGKIISKPITQEFSQGEVPVLSSRRNFPIGYQKNRASAGNCKAISPDAVLVDSYLTNETSVCGTFTEVFSFNKPGSSFSELYTAPDWLNMPHRILSVCCVPSDAIKKKADGDCGKVNLTNGKGNKYTAAKATCQQAGKSCITEYYKNSHNQPIEVINPQVVDNIDNFIEDNTDDAKSCITVNKNDFSSISAPLVEGYCCP